MSGVSLDDQIDEVRGLMADRLRVRGKTLEIQVHKAGRLLPKRVRREAIYLAQAATVVQHPKLSMMVDTAKANTAHAQLVDFLKSVDPLDRAKGKFLGWLASISVGVIVIFVVVVWILVERGIV
mgnify:CR=1 FL=1